MSGNAYELLRRPSAQFHALMHNRCLSEQPYPSIVDRVAFFGASHVARKEDEVVDMA